MLFPPKLLLSLLYHAQMRFDAARIIWELFHQLLRTLIINLGSITNILGQVLPDVPAARAAATEVISTNAFFVSLFFSFFFFLIITTRWKREGSTRARFVRFIRFAKISLSHLGLSGFIKRTFPSLRSLSAFHKAIKKNKEKKGE